MVTIERFVAVWCPLKRLKSTKTLLGISIIGALLYNIPRFLEFESRSVCTHQRISVPCNQIYEDPDLALHYDNSTVSMVGSDIYLTKYDILSAIYIYWSFTYLFLLDNYLQSNEITDPSPLHPNLHFVDEANHHRTDSVSCNCHIELLYGMQVRKFGLIRSGSCLPFYEYSISIYLEIHFT